MNKQRLFTINFLLFFASLYQTISTYSTDRYYTSVWMTEAVFSGCFLILLIFYRKIPHLGILTFLLFNAFFLNITFFLAAAAGLGGIVILMIAGIALIIIDGFCFQSYLTRKR